ncbi:flagellar biosynthesis anti-sigma factor FlgM [Bacillus testis]|uniref:flagellar biosynthesis anti-sigma factor FlgM n=1 Tax=Bacillus testis TaxID=1622072 RepID=UPI00067EB95B|nr:flagellar biosynthesis anti-sigma factor FlgM [Bacillus testis]
MKINQVGPAGMNPYKKNINKLDELKQSTYQKDKIEISSTAKEMQQSSQIVAQRQERVQDIKVSIQNGTYQVDPKATAKSLLDFYSKNK